MGRPTGYADPFSVQAGDVARFFVDSDGRAYQATVVRLIHGDTAVRGPGFRTEEVPSDIAGTYEGQRQRTVPGSFVVAEDRHGMAPIEELSIVAWIFPTALTSRVRQGLVGRWTSSSSSGFALVIDEGETKFVVRASGGMWSVRCGAPLVERAWHLIVATYCGPARRIEIRQRCGEPWTPSRMIRNGRECSVAAIDMAPGEWTVGATSARPRGATWQPQDPYDGKVDSPVILGQALGEEAIEAIAGGREPSQVSDDIIVEWDLSPRSAGSNVPDRGPHGLTARCVNMPYTAVTGHNWTGRETDFKRAPEQYRALQFNSDALTDADWDASIQWLIPDGLRSGVYALRTSTSGGVDHIPFVIRPVAAPNDADIVVLLPTLTYWAYANERSLAPDQLTEWRPAPAGWREAADPRDEELSLHPEYGKSLYDRHCDGTGCSISSRRRPISNLRPDYRYHTTSASRHLGADLYLVDWLEALGFAYHIITDEDLHAEGSALLSGYRVLITGSHPEYATEAMLDALEDYVFSDGKVMYLGGNGLWWVTSLCGDQESCIEQRRGYAGSRLWESRPGECYHGSTGELGGVWRHRGRGPNRILGVGTSAYGHDGESRGYVRQPDSFDAEMAFIFEGIGSDEVIGHFGLSMNGAAGDEIDRADVGLGTPRGARVLATAAGFSDTYQVVIEDLQQTAAQSGGRHHPNVRADMVYCQAPEGGAVFSVGSIAWSASLSHNDYENNVSRITENVLRRFSARDSVSPSGSAPEVAESVAEVRPSDQSDEGSHATEPISESTHRNSDP